MEITALGMIETSGLLSAIEAADAGLKAANVRLLGTDYVRGGLVMVRFEGDVAAVQAAVDAGASAAQRVGNLLSAHVIPRAMPEVFCMLASDPSLGPGKRSQGGCAACGGCEGGKRELSCARSAHPRTGRPDEDGPDAPAGGRPATPDGDGAVLPAPVRRDRPARIRHAGPAGSRSGAPAAGPFATGPIPDREQLMGWKVVALRSYVRKLPGFPMTANEIRYANKAALLDAIEAYRGAGRP